MQNDKLLPCPFCGGEAKFDRDGLRWFVKCRKCFCRSEYGSNEYFARMNWNTRKPMERIVERLKEVSFERYGNQGMGGELVVNFDDAIEIVKGGVDNAG